MKKQDIIRAWKDEAFRESLSEEERALLPDHPAGMAMISDEDLAFAVGGLTAIEEPREQTGTNAEAACWCEKSRTANSDGGSCWCTC